MPTPLAASLQSTFLGTPVRVVTIHGQELEGEVFCYDVASDSLVLRRRELPGNGVSYRWVRGCSQVIRAVSALGPPSQDAEALPAVDLAALAGRSRRAEAPPGPGRDAFRLLSETMGCEWEEDVLKVLAPYNVRVLEPYAPESCSGGEPWALQEVRAVLRRGEAASGAPRALRDEEAASPEGLPEGAEHACAGGAGAGAARAAGDGSAVSASPAGSSGAPGDGEAVLERGAPGAPVCGGSDGAACAGASSEDAQLGQVEEREVQEAEPLLRPAPESPTEQEENRPPPCADKERLVSGADGVEEGAGRS